MYNGIITLVFFLIKVGFFILLAGQSWKNLILVKLKCFSSVIERLKVVSILNDLNNFDRNIHKMFFIFIKSERIYNLRFKNFFINILFLTLTHPKVSSVGFKGCCFAGKTYTLTGPQKLFYRFKKMFINFNIK